MRRKSLVATRIGALVLIVAPAARSAQADTGGAHVSDAVASGSLAARRADDGTVARSLAIPPKDVDERIALAWGPAALAAHERWRVFTLDNIEGGYGRATDQNHAADHRLAIFPVRSHA